MVSQDGDNAKTLAKNAEKWYNKSDGEHTDTLPRNTNSGGDAREAGQKVAYHGWHCDIPANRRYSATRALIQQRPAANSR